MDKAPEGRGRQPAQPEAQEGFLEVWYFYWAWVLTRVDEVHGEGLWSGGDGRAPAAGPCPRSASLHPEPLPAA